MRAVCYAAILFLAMLTGCSSGDKLAAELLDTARFEEKQNNIAHAAKLYEEILKKHPSSAAAKDAAVRLGEIKQKTP